MENKKAKISTPSVKTNHHTETESTEKNKAEFSFEISLLKGIKITSKNHEKEDVIHIIKSIFSPKRPLFWLVISKAIAIIYLVIRHSDFIFEFIKSPP